MLLKDLVLNGLEPFESFKIQYIGYKGEIVEKQLTQQLYERLADREVDNYYIDINKSTLAPYISIKIVEE
jgi:hypothetical protein